MRTFRLTAVLILFVGLSACKPDAPLKVEPKIEPVASGSTSQTVKAGCATCIFEMKNVSGCPLAVMVDGTPYLVTGSDIDDHGDAHAADGLCNQTRMAVVEGKVEEGKFHATHFELKP